MGKTSVIKKLLKVVDIKIVNGNYFYVVDYHGTTYMVKQYPFQYRLPLPNFITCVIKEEKGGKKLFFQDKQAVLEGLYEEGCSYKFYIEDILQDEKTKHRYILLEDEFGLSHRFYRPSLNALSMKGKAVECKVTGISNGILSLENDLLRWKEAESASISSQIKDVEERLFQKLSEEREKDAMTFKKESYSGVWRSIIDKYPDSAHFIYELLQNADDVEATEVDILLDKDFLVFKHNGRIKFSISEDKPSLPNYGHINSITGIGASTKSYDDATNKIGKFGVGFKSVFQYTDRPEIYDDNFRFAIEDYIVPKRLFQDHSLRKEGETLFYLPFFNAEKSSEEIHQKLLNLDNPILFLRHLKKITWKTTKNDQEHVYSKEIRRKEIKDEICCELITLDNCGIKKTIWLFTKGVWVSEIQKTHTISVGYYLNDNEDSIDTICRPRIFCFFPTSESFDLCVVCHAPFLLVDSRQQLKRNENVNKFFINELSKLAARALPLLCELGNEDSRKILNDNIFSIVPLKERYAQDEVSSNPFYQEYLKVIKREKVLMSRNGSYIWLENAYVALPAVLTEIVSTPQLRELTNESSIDFLDTAVTSQKGAIWDYIINTLKVKQFTTELLVRSLTPEFMDEQNKEWILKLYSFFRESARNLFLDDNKRQEKLIRYAPIIKTTTGLWIPPFIKNEVGDAVNVFYPLTDSDTVYHFINKEYAENEQARRFFDDLKLKQPEKGDYISSIILQKYAGECNLNDDEVVSDFDILFEYSQTIGGSKRLEYMDLLRKNLFICACNIINKDDAYLFSAYQIYDDTSSIRDFYGEYSENIYIFDYNYYQSVIDKYSKEKIRSFLIELGMTDTPRIVRKEYDGIDFWQTNEILTEKQKECVQDGLRKVRYQKFTKAWIVDYQMDGLIGALDNITPEKSKMIWKVLCDTDLSKQKVMSFEYQYYGRYEINDIPSSFVSLLQTVPWLYKSNDDLCSAANITIEELKDAGYAYNESVFDCLGIEWGQSPLNKLGATEEQQKVYNRGLLFKNDEDARLAWKLLEEQKRKEAALSSREYQQNPLPSREDVRELNESEMFVESGRARKEPQVKEEQTTEEKIEEIKQRQEEETKAEIEREELIATTGQLMKYTFKWFCNMFELEYSSEVEDVESVSNKAINISFNRVEKELGSERIYILRNPSRMIPLQIEEIGGLEVRFVFSNRDELVVGFEVASVRDYTLRVKAKAADANSLNGIDWQRCTKASVSINNPIALMTKLKDAFRQLGLDDNFSLKDNLHENISFVFGPPGTGKTTTIAKHISQLMSTDEETRILVLAPTNKACDVLTRKLMDTNDDDSWLGRFVATGDESIEKEGRLVDRDSDIVCGKCCVVSTIARLPYDGFKDWRLAEVDWDYIFIDEASMIPLGQIAYAIYRFEGKRIIISGDPMQIAPIVHEQLWKDENIYTMVNLTRFDNPKTEPIDFDIQFLTTQFRSVPNIGQLFSDYAYGGLLKHNRAQESQKPLNIDSLDIKTINYIPFRVERYDSMFGPKRLSGSPVHVYSVLLVTEFTKFLAEKYSVANKDEKLTIGIICPYKAEAQFINQLLEQTKEIPENISITVGTIHGFQGDECDVIISVFNPPTGLKTASEQIHLNNQNIINVAVSRARDYLFIFLPHRDMEGYSNLLEINRLGRLSKGYGVVTCDQLEKIMFGRSQYIEQNAFVTSHQMANVYSQADYMYEVRIDDSSVDIQIGNTLIM